MINIRRNEIRSARVNYSTPYSKTVNSTGDPAEKPNASPLFLTLFGVYLSFHLNGFFGSIPGLRVGFNLVISFLVIALAFIETPDFLQKLLTRNKGYLLFLSLLVIFLIDLLLNRLGSALSLAFLPIFVIFSAFVYLQDKKPSSGLIMWILLNFLYKIILTMMWLPKDELIVKQYDHNGYAGADGITRSLIGYGSIYLLVPLIILMIGYMKCCKRTNKVFLIITILASVALVYSSQVSMMIFALTIMLCVYFLLRKATTRNKKILIFVVILFLCGVYVFRVPLLNFMSRLDFLGDTVNNRINGLLNVMNHDMDYVYSEYSGSMVEGDSAVNRFYSYAESLKAFTHNFFLGDLTPNAYAGAGHSSLIDFVSRYGIFAVFPWVAFVYHEYKVNLKQYPDFAVPIGILYAYMLVISCLNNLSMSTIVLLSTVMIQQMCGAWHTVQQEQPSRRIRFRIK